MATERLFSANDVSMLWLAHLLGAAAGFGLQMLFARTLGVEGFGELGAALGFLGILVPLASFGVGQYWLKLFGEHGRQGLPGLDPSLMFTVLMASLTVALALGWAAFGPHDTATGLLLALMTPFVLGQVALELVGAKLQLEGRFAALSLFQLVPHLSRLAIALAALFAFGPMLSPMHAGSAYFVVGFLLVVIAVASIARMRGSGFDTLADAGPAGQVPGRIGFSQVVHEIWPFGLGALFQLIYYQSDIVLLRYMDSTAAAGQYNLAFVVVSATFILPSVLYQKYLMARIHRWASQDRAKLFGVLRDGARWMLLLGGGVCLLLVVAADLLVGMLVGPGYAQSASLLRVLAVGIPLVYIAFNYGAALATGRHMRRKAALMGTGAVVNVVLNAILIPRYSATGAAVSTVVTNLLLLIMYYTSFKRHVAGNIRR